ncbi:MAG: hypothetical protein ACRDRU_27100 [Pseudonocardiaceae bacterium]
MILDQTNRLRPGLLVEPARHRGILPNLGGAHETRDGSTIEVGHREENTGHRRRDKRVLKVIDLHDPADQHHKVRFPGARQAFLIERYRHFPDGTITTAAIPGITSLTPQQASPTEPLWRILVQEHLVAHSDQPLV